MRIQIFSHVTKPIVASTGAALVLAAMLTAATPLVCAAQPAVAEAESAQSGVSRVAAEGKPLHVIVGHSIFLDTKNRLRRVYVSDPTIINSVTLSPTQIIVTAMAPGVSSLTLLDETGQAQSYVVSSDIDLAGLRTAMAQAMRGEAVIVDGSGGHVVLSGTVSSDAKADSAVKLAALYAKDVANALTVVAGHPKQVRLQVRILEVDRTKLLQQGINLFNPGGNTNYLASATTAQYPSTMQYSTGTGGNIGGGGSLTTSSPLNFLLYSAKLNLGATIEDLESKQVLQILAEPTITTISGVKADFLSGGEFPFPIVQPGGTGGAPVVTIQFRPYGVKLEFTPIVNEDGTIRLKVAPEVSALDYSNTVTIGGFTVPSLSSRRAETEVELRSNQSFAISGLLDQRTTDILAKNPGVASIPILGILFKSKNVNHSTSELVVVITPTVVDPLTEPSTPSQPELPIPTLDTDKYDKSLGRDGSPHPTAPPIAPDQPPTSIPPVFPQYAPVKAPAAVAAPSAAPKAAPSAVRSASNPGPARPANAAPGANTNAARNSSPPAAVALSVPPTRAVPPSSANRNPSTQPVSAVRTGASHAPPIVEVMTLSHDADADAMVDALKRRGYDVAVNRDPSDSLLHLDVGPFSSIQDAETMRQRLLQDGYNAVVK